MFKQRRGFAKAVMQHFPKIPVEDEDRLTDPEIRKNFIERIFSFQMEKKASRF